MYSLGAIWQKEPVVIATAIRSVIWVLVLVGFLTDPPVTASVLAGIALVSELLLGLFVRNSTTSITSPTLPQGTEVTVVTPGVQPNTTTVL